MRVLWTHNCDPNEPNALVYIDTAAEGLRRLGVDLHVQYLGYLRSVPGLLRARRRMTDITRGFDLVHAQYGSACGFATAGARGIPKVLSIRGNDWNVYSHSGGFFYVHTRLARAMTRLSVSDYDGVVCVSKRLAAEVAPRAPRAELCVLPSPIDLDRFAPLDRSEARARLGFPGSTEPWILFNAVSLADPIKRFPLAKQAFDLANARAGGTLRLRIANKITHAEVPLFTAACDLILMTSETEGWPNSVKEALACNLPFVATDVSDLREIARLEPSCRVCPAHPEALAAGIGEVLALASKGEPPNLRRHVDDMRLDVSSERLLRMYEGLVA